MDYVGSGNVPVINPEDQARVARVTRLAAITGPPDKSRCAICGAAGTTKDVYGIGATNNATGAEIRSGFHLCATCVPVLYADLEALQRLGQKGAH
jgi:hypothetical protein